MTNNQLDSMLQSEILKQIESKDEEIDALKATVRQLKEAIYWALGERDDFPIRYPGDGAFYWRTELRKRSGLPVNGVTHEPGVGPSRAFLEMPEGYSGPVKISNPGMTVAEVTIEPGVQQQPAERSILLRCDEWFAAYMHDRENYDEAAELLAAIRNATHHHSKDPEHVCGLQGFGRGGPEALNDSCPACEASALKSGDVYCPKCGTTPCQRLHSRT